MQTMSTSRVGWHLHQRVEEHKRSTIGNHVKDEHEKDPETIGSNYRILKKCQSKLDCLIFEILFIRKLQPKLNNQKWFDPREDITHAAIFLYCFYVES